MPFCTACGTENPQQAKFCLACGTTLAETPPPSEERKVITAVFVDLVGSTARSERLDPEDVKALVAPYHAQVRAELERHGGTFEKFSGDAVLALFGTPKAHEDDPERAIRAGLAVRSAIADLNAADEWLDLHIRIGIHTGEALVMLGARPGEGEWSAAGDVLNTAARIQSAAPTDGILVGQQTYAAANDLFDFREAEPLQAKGKSEPVAVWEVIGARDGAAARPVVDIPLVGREVELEELLSFCDAVLQERYVGIATILGSPGIGKTRLLLELVRRLEDRCDVHWGRCLSYGEGITYWPVEEIIKDAAGILHDDDADATGAKLAALLETLGTSDPDQLRTIAAAVSNLVGVATTPRGTYSAAEIGQAELHWGLRRLLELRAERRPTVVVVEDLHWAEPTLLELLTFVGESSAEVPLIVLGTARPEAAETPTPIFITAGSRRVLELDALSGEDSVALVAELVPAGLQVPVDRLLEVAGGNPLFLEETVRMLADVGASAEGEELPVPSNLQALIASRLDRLGPSEKRLAQNASVIGTSFWLGAIASMNGIEGDLDEALAELARRDLVRPGDASRMAGEREYVFKHALIRDVSYGQLPKGRRAVLHRRFADWVIALPGREEELSEIVGYHLEQACLTARTVARPPEPPPVEGAVAALMRAAAKAERREGFREAERFYARALELVEDAESRLELRLKRCRSLTSLGELRPARDDLLELAEETLAADLRDLRCETLIALANIDYKQGRASDARRHLEEAQALAAQLGDRRLEIRARYESALSRSWFEGEDTETIEDLRSGLAISEELDDLALRIEGHMRLGFVLFNLGRLRDSELHLERCAELAREVGDHRDEARVTFLLALAKHYQGEPEEARRLSLQASEWFERTGDSYFQIQNLRALAMYALAGDRLQEAEERLQAAIPLALDSGGWLVLEIYRLLVETLVRQDRLDDARELVAFAARNVPEEDVYSRAALLLAEASVAAAEGDGDAALSRYPQALLLLEEQRLLIDLAEGHLTFGRTLRRFGCPEEAKAQFERAFQIAAPMGAQALIAELQRESPGLARPTAAGDRPPAT
jgi:class 3 adenylate cyclase/tetratricopeptide (TPR) repeat protein